MLSSQGLVLVTAMAVSAGTIILFDLFKEKYFSDPHFRQNQDCPPPEKKALKSCLVSSGSKKSEAEKKKKKNRVKFAVDVKDSDKNINGEAWRKREGKFGEIQSSGCRNDMIGIQKMPANHVALYSGILKNRVHRMQYSC